ncbi:MAG: translocation/assembly module TamB domain-containing protein, partial [Spirochaetales bacterium]|nr:translocation/assembly module TamB domain-containing protein [Spirochaetales bacterium]
FKANQFPLAFSDKINSGLTINTTGYFTNSEDWKILVNNFKIDGIPTGLGYGNIGFSLLAKPGTGSIYNLKYSDDKTNLQGGGDLILHSINPSISGTTHLELKDINEDDTDNTLKESYEIVLGINEDNLVGHININNFKLSRLTSSTPIAGELNGNINIGGTPKNPNIELNVNTANAAVYSQRVTLKTSLKYNDLILKCLNLSGSYSDIHLKDFTGELNFQNGIHNLDGSFKTDAKSLNVNSKVSITAKTSIAEDYYGIIESLENINAEIEVKNLNINNDKKDPWTFDLLKNKELISFHGGSHDELNGTFFQNGKFILSSEAPFPVTLSASGSIHESIINASVKNISYTADNLKIPGFTIFKGVLSGELLIKGTLNDPDFFGQLNVRGLELTPPISLDVSKPTNGSFFISGKDITLPPTRIITNNGIVDLKLSAIMERWLPRNFDIEVRAPQDKPVSARFYSPPFYVDGFTSGNLHIFGDLSTLNIEGYLDASEATVMINSNLDIKSQKGNSMDINADLDLHISADNHFYWPTQRAPIISASLQTGKEVNINYTSAEGLYVDGDLSLSGGEIYYFERSFFLKKGNVKFLGKTQNKIDPLLNIEAEIREINNLGDLTKIILSVNNSPLSSFKPQFSSDPPMSTNEILSILGGNIFGDDLEDVNFDNVLYLGADLFSQFVVVRRLETQLREFLRLDLLSIRSSLLSNLLEYNVFERDTMQDNIFTKYLDNTTLFLGKYLTDNIFLQGIFQFDLYNDKGYSDNLKLNLDSEISLEWESPIANFEFSIYPDFEDPVEGMKKTSLSLSWQFSY